MAARRRRGPSAGIAIASGALVIAPVLLAAFPPTLAAEPGSVGAFGRPVYVEVTEAAGLGGFRHAGYLGPGNLEDPGALFTEFTGPGACWLDADQDGLLDLYLVNGLHLTFPDKNAEFDPHSMLYLNEGGGDFADASAGSGADLRATHQGCAAADYDNDGLTDLYVTGWNGNALLRNLGGGVFANVTAPAGVRDEACGEAACWGSSASWLDYDLDGCLDLYVDHFTPFDPADPPEGNGPFAGQRNRLFRSQCDGTFADATQAAGLVEVHDSWSSIAADLDDDGWPDLYVSNDGDPNDLYLNNGDGTFTRQGASAAADPRGGMGTAAGDWSRDGRLDLVTTNFIEQTNGLFESAGGDYVDIGGEEPFADAHPWSGWGAHVYDMDNDGLQDLVVLNGFTEDLGIAPTREPMLAYEQAEPGAWRSVGADLGPDFQQHLVLRGGAWADYDNDGDVDFLAAETGEAPTHLFRADRTGGNFLSVDVVGAAPGVSRDAVGARVTVAAAGVGSQMQEKILGSSYMSSNDPRLHFGLGAADAADVQVRWPGGTTETFPGVRANSFVRVTQGSGAAVLRELPLLGLAGPAAARYGEPASFRAAASAGVGADIAGVAWDFDDGAGAEGAAVDHAFRDVGDLVVRATGTDTLGRAHTRALVVGVTDDLTAAVAPDQGVFLPTEQPTGRVQVAFSDGLPVRGAIVQVVVRASTGSAEADAVVAQLPRDARAALGFVEYTLEVVTADDGTARFAVPWTIEGPSRLAPFVANHPGLYLVEVRGGARGSSFEPVASSYRVGVPGT